jgi:4-amino-4-deoxy-L-arabinose transferase-like glycosyltransferase
MLNRLTISPATPRSAVLTLGSSLREATGTNPVTKIVSQCDLHSRDATIFYVPDTGTYVVPAQEIIAHHRFFAHGVPEIVRTPGYPFLLIPGLLLNHLPLLTISLQVLLSCFTVYMVYRTAQLLFTSERIAIAAAALYAIEPLSVLYTGLIVTETLFTSFVMLWLYFLLRYLAGPTRRDLIFSGIFLAVSVYVRPIGYFLPVIIASGLLAWILTGAQRNKQLLLLLLCQS